MNKMSFPTIQASGVITPYVQLEGGAVVTTDLMNALVFAAQSGGGGTGSAGPQGFQGVQGVQGPVGTGVQGTQGLQGATGPSGGPQGTQGFQGVQGVQGSQGVQGPPVTGPQGFQGVQGADGPAGGPAGPQGVQGFQGVQGAQGLQGVQGGQGLQGPQGVQGAQGLQGVQGAQGAQGAQGVQGVQGAQGFQGLQGAQGAQGLQGAQGAQGVQGAQGLQGVQGPQGVQGVQGSTGQNGISSGLVLFMDTAGGGYPQTGTLDLTATTSTQTTITSGNLTNQSDVLLGTFLTGSNVLSSPIIAPGFWNVNMYGLANNTGVSYYAVIDYVDSDGTSNPVSLASGAGSPVNVGITQAIYVQALSVSGTTLPDLTKRIRVRIYGNFSGSNRSITLEFRNQTISHVISTLVTSPPQGPQGLQGVQGIQGSIGVQGPAGQGSNTLLATNNLSVTGGTMNDVNLGSGTFYSLVGATTLTDITGFNRAEYGRFITVMNNTDPPSVVNFVGYSLSTSQPTNQIFLPSATNFSLSAVGESVDFVYTSISFLASTYWCILNAYTTL